MLCSFVLVKIDTTIRIGYDRYYRSMHTNDFRWLGEKLLHGHHDSALIQFAIAIIITSARDMMCAAAKQNSIGFLDLPQPQHDQQQ